MLSFCLGEARTSHRLPAASTVIIWKIRSPINGANRPVRFQKSHVPAVHILLFSAESSVAGYALRHRAQQYSGQKKNSFCPFFPLPRFQHRKAFFSFPPYRCLSLRLSSLTLRKSQRFPMFLQHIAVIHFTAVAVRFVAAVYTLPSPRTAVCHCTVPAQYHTAAFPIPCF